MSKGHILAVVGAQYGSEGKGVIVNHLADRYNVHVRTGGPNAGHSFNENGRVWKMQVIPCGWTNPRADLVLGRGMLINPVILRRELEQLGSIVPHMCVRERLFVDAYAGILDDELHHKQGEGGTEGELHQRIGSTGEGVGAARIDRIRRDPSRFKLFHEVAAQHDLGDLIYWDTSKLVQMRYDAGDNVLLEGTQGSGLSLIHGPWPFVTSHDTNAAQLAADAGVPPQLVSQVLLVARTHPIRVAGNSGPLKDEMTWGEVSDRVGRPTIEKTTVTQKVRRVGAWDEELMDRAITLNRPTSVALTFVDYISPEDEGETSYDNLTAQAKGFIQYVESRFSTRVSLVGTGGDGWMVIERGRV